MKLKVALIGLGARVQQTVLPALSCAEDYVQLVGAYRRTPSELEAFSRRSGVPPLSGLLDPRLQEADIISVCVMPGQLPSILRTWQQSSLDFSKVTLLVDTPVLSPSGAASVAAFARFARVLVAEDYVTNPVFRLCRQLQEEGRIGRLRRIQLNHSGFRHHAVATCRLLCGGEFPRRVERFPLSTGASEYMLHFSHGVRASFVEPRDYGVGTFLIHGSEGTVADYDLKERRRAGKHLWVGVSYEPGRRFALTLNSDALPMNPNDELFARMLDHGALEDRSLVNLLKIRALVDMFVAFARGDRRFDYGFEQGLFDSWVLHFVERLGVPFHNALAPRKPLLLRSLVDWLPRVQSLTRLHGRPPSVQEQHTAAPPPELESPAPACSSPG